ncbi:MAG: T9SS type A sorting domain-containing protein [Prolixibacteraceae bacterium]
MKTLVYIFFLLSSLFCYPQYVEELKHNHIGKFCSGGTFQTDSNNFVLSGSGFDIWSSTDEFDFAWVKIWGDIEISVKINSVEQIHDWAKAGIMIREDLTGPSKNIMMLMTPKKVASCQFRAFDNSGCSSNTMPNRTFPCWLKLIRKGNTFYSLISSDGKNWDLFSPVDIEMTGSVYYGLAVTSRVQCELAKAEFENLTISKTLSEIPLTVSYHALKSNTLYSDYLKEDVKISVGLPYKYNHQEAVAYPVLYFLDQNLGSYHTVIRELSAKKLIPDVLTAGVAFPVESKRDSDYTVNFSSFHSFLNNELIPHIDNQFNTDTLKRTLFGHSFGGLACLNTMFLCYDYNTIPFRNIIASSPAIWWPDSKQAYSKEQNLYRQTSILPVNLYMTIGTDEGFNATSNFSKMARTLDNRGYEYLNIYTDANDGKTLSTNADLSFYEGSIWVLNQPVVSPQSIATNLPEVDSHEFSVYPNPTSGVINIFLNKTPEQNATAEIINLQGNAVFTKKLHGQTNTELNLRSLPKGIYLVKITSKRTFRIKKIELY